MEAVGGGIAVADVARAGVDVVDGELVADDLGERIDDIEQGPGPTERQVHVRKQLRYFALLALRVLTLLVLALAFAKPLLPGSPPALTDSASGSHLIVIDSSASMQRTGLQSLAIDAARSALDEVPRTALVQVATAAARLRVLTEATAASAAATCS